jgi:hypothetical protein
MQMFAELKKQGDTKYSNPRSLAEAIVEVNIDCGRACATTFFPSHIGADNLNLLSS